MALQPQRFVEEYVVYKGPAFKKGRLPLLLPQAHKPFCGYTSRELRSSSVDPKRCGRERKAKDVGQNCGYMVFPAYTVPPTPLLKKQISECSEPTKEPLGRGRSQLAVLLDRILMVHVCATRRPLGGDDIRLATLPPVIYAGECILSHSRHPDGSLVYEDGNFWVKFANFCSVVPDRAAGKMSTCTQHVHKLINSSHCRAQARSSSLSCSIQHERSH